MQEHFARDALVAVTTATTRAQLPVGTILGQVTDPIGAAVPTAELTIRNIDTWLANTKLDCGTDDDDRQYFAPNSVFSQDDVLMSEST